jgi:hypothetical protein
LEIYIMAQAKKTVANTTEPTMAEMIAAAVAAALAGQVKTTGKQVTAAKAETPKGRKVQPDWYDGKNGKSLSIDGQDDYVVATLETGEKIRLTRKFKSIVAYKA